jgi:hypothetical protein
VFPVRYELNLYILFRGNLVFRGLNMSSCLGAKLSTGTTLPLRGTRALTSGNIPRSSRQQREDKIGAVQMEHEN